MATSEEGRSRKKDKGRYKAWNSCRVSMSDWSISRVDSVFGNCLLWTMQNIGKRAGLKRSEGGWTKEM